MMKTCQDREFGGARSVVLPPWLMLEEAVETIFEFAIAKQSFAAAALSLATKLFDIIFGLVKSLPGEFFANLSGTFRIKPEEVTQSDWENIMTQGTSRFELQKSMYGQDGNYNRYSRNPEGISLNLIQLIH